MLGGKKGAQNLGTYLQEKETFITGAPQQTMQSVQIVEQPIIREQHVHTTQVADVRPRIIDEGSTVIRHDEKAEFRKVELG